MPASYLHILIKYFTTNNNVVVICKIYRMLRFVEDRPRLKMNSLGMEDEWRLWINRSSIVIGFPQAPLTGNSSYPIPASWDVWSVWIIERKVGEKELNDTLQQGWVWAISKKHLWFRYPCEGNLILLATPALSHHNRCYLVIVQFACTFWPFKVFCDWHMNQFT